MRSNSKRCLGTGCLPPNNSRIRRRPSWSSARVRVAASLRTSTIADTPLEGTEQVRGRHHHVGDHIEASRFHHARIRHTNCRVAGARHSELPQEADPFGGKACIGIAQRRQFEPCLFKQRMYIEPRRLKRVGDALDPKSRTGRLISTASAHRRRPLRRSRRSCCGIAGRPHECELAARATKLAAWVTDTRQRKAYRFNLRFGGSRDRNKRSASRTRWHATRPVERNASRRTGEGSAQRHHEQTFDHAVRIAQRTAPTGCAVIGQSGSA